MLSINIPVFNVEVVDLVSDLIAQAEKLAIAFEIRVYDDGSEEKFKLINRKIQQVPKVVYVELGQNLGRAAIRNRMGLESKFKYLLFIDADSKLRRENYLATFVENAKPNRVLCGGTAYSNEKPDEPEKLLRWVYGTEREAVSAETRNHKKGFIITSNNFLIEKSVFEVIHFRDDLKKYGHEDTLLGYDLYLKGIEIFHIDNPVEHTGLENSEVFLAKTRTALKNLHYIANELLANDKTFSGQVSFLNRFNKIKKMVPRFLLRSFHRVFRGSIEKNLRGKSPNLFWFDVYKIGEYSGLG